MTQLSLKKGLKAWKEHGEEAATKESGQPHHRDTFNPVDPKTMTEKQHEQALESHLFLKEKRDGTIKG